MPSKVQDEISSILELQRPLKYGISFNILQGMTVRIHTGISFKVIPWSLEIGNG